MAITLTLWFGASMHCNLEAAGFLAEHEPARTGCCPAATDDCHMDGCKVVESAAYRSTNLGDLVVAPDLLACLCQLGVYRLFPPSSELIDATAKVATQEIRPWVPVWHFERRTVAAPGAPSCPVA
ncbi:MAG: hypothetical protein PSV13_14295 [Lacunisphaera sp.]|nr:hypothetical protein [Lacunisphaera sp.]